MTKKEIINKYEKVEKKMFKLKDHQEELKTEFVSHRKFNVDDKVLVVDHLGEIDRGFIEKIYAGKSSWRDVELKIKYIVKSTIEKYPTAKELLPSHYNEEHITLIG